VGGSSIIIFVLIAILMTTAVGDMK